VACKASGTVFLNAREPKVGPANTANIRQFQVAVETFSGHMRSGTSGCKMLVPDMQNQDQRPKATAVLHETRTEEFIEWKKYLMTTSLWFYSQHVAIHQSPNPRLQLFV